MKRTRDTGWQNASKKRMQKMQNKLKPSGYGHKIINVQKRKTSTPQGTKVEMERVAFKPFKGAQLNVKTIHVTTKQLPKLRRRITRVTKNGHEHTIKPESGGIVPKGVQKTSVHAKSDKTTTTFTGPISSIQETSINSLQKRSSILLQAIREKIKIPLRGRK